MNRQIGCAVAVSGLLVGMMHFASAAIVEGGGFSKLRPCKGTANTTFAIDGDAEKVKVTVECAVSDPAKLGEFAGEGFADGPGSVEVFLAPDGTVQNYYQFVVSAMGTERKAYFFAEKGGIEPDPYDPEWTSSTRRTAKGWACDIEIPLSSFYMTRNSNWKTTWLVNVTVNDKTGGGLSTWAKMERSFHEPDHFRKVGGFPRRGETDDVYVESAAMAVEKLEDGLYKGRLRVTATAAGIGDYEFRAEGASAPKTAQLKTGTMRMIETPAAFKATGRQRTRLVLKRVSDGREYARYYPVRIDYEPLAYRLTLPEYRDNFYPGQDSSKVAGTVSSLAGGEVTVTLEGPGIPKAERKVPSGGTFEFATPDFAFGTATLTFAADGKDRTVRVRKLDKSGHMMTWISGGNLVVDGKPTFRRDFYAPYFAASKAYIEIYTNDAANGFCLTRPITRGSWFEPCRLMGGRAFEAKEVKKDVVPCKELFAKIDKILEDCKDKDFGYWYISDEPDVRGLSEVYLRHIYEYVKERDPYHVILSASRAPAKYSVCADWIETHPYLDPHVDEDGNRLYQHNMKDFGPYIDQLVNLGRSDKCIGFIPTAFTYQFNSSQSDYPTFDEYVCHVMTALAHGAKTLWPFAGADVCDRPGMYRAIRWTFQFTHAFEDLLLFGERKFLVKTADRETVEWTYKGDKLTVDINLNRPFDVKCAFDGARRGSVLDEFAAEREAAAAAEAKRTDPRNLLVGRECDIVVTKPGESDGGGYGAAYYKLFDGARISHAWRAPNKGEKFIELAFPKFTPEFRRVAVSGTGLEGLKVKVWKRRQWVEISGKTDVRKYTTILDLPETMKAIRMRFEFPSKADTDLYEIELVADRPPAPRTKPQPDATARTFLTSTNAHQTVGFTFDPANPWFVARLDKLVWKENPKWNYHSWMIRIFPDVGRIGGGWLTPVYGHYMVKLPADFAAKDRKRHGTVDLYGYNYDLEFGHFGFEACPPNRAEVNTFGKRTLSAGDAFEVTLTLAEPAEDATCAIIGNAINGRSDITLDPVDESMKVWRGKVTIEKVKTAQKSSGETTLLLGALGGAFTESIITPIPANFK